MSDIPEGLKATVDHLTGSVRLTWQDVAVQPPALVRIYDVERDGAVIAQNLPEAEFTETLPPGTYIYRVRTSPAQSPMVWDSGIWGRDTWGA